MSATEQMRQMLNELMGSDANLGGGDARDRTPFTDHRVCRPFLIGCCPHDILSSTRMDLGDCPRMHDSALRADYDRAQKEKDHFFDMDALDLLERFLDDTDRKTEIAKKRLAETQEELSADAERVLILNEQIGKTLAEAERLGEDGKVDESLKLMEQVEVLRKEKQEADQEYRASMPASSYQQQKLRVCEVCGAYLGIHDNDRRLADHFGGKLHMGFVFLREQMAELKEKATERRALRDAERRPERRDYGGSRNGDADRGKERDVAREGDRDKDRRRSSDRDRERRRRSRSREDRDRRSSKGYSSSSRDRDRDRARDSDRHSSSRRDRDRGDRADRDRQRRRDRSRSGDRSRRDRSERSSDRSSKRRSGSRDASAATAAAEPDANKVGESEKRASPPPHSADVGDSTQNDGTAMTTDGEGRADGRRRGQGTSDDEKEEGETTAD